jgi:hypothetical protein
MSQVTGVDDRMAEKRLAVVEYLQFREVVFAVFRLNSLQQCIRTLFWWSESSQVSPTLRRRIRNYYSACWKQSPAPYMEVLSISRCVSVPFVWFHSKIELPYCVHLQRHCKPTVILILWSSHPKFSLSVFQPEYCRLIFWMSLMGLCAALFFKRFLFCC